MDCPRCGEDLTHYGLGDAETWSCDQCQYSGIPVEHRSDRAGPESWAESLRRFYGDQDGSSVDEEATVAESPDEQCAAATKSGERCSRAPKPDERYCSQHLSIVAKQGQEAITDYES
jgi:hypothetical protein